MRLKYNYNSTKVCPPCFYGTICQFTTSYYSISLETLLNMFLEPQRIIVAIIVVFFLISTICNILSIATFCHGSRGRGNRIYRLWIAIIGQLGTMAFAFRLLLIFIKQSSGIIGCFGLDYLISVLPALYNSLTACVFIEQVIVAYENLVFNKEDSRHTATIVIPVLIFYHFLVPLYKPFHNQLLADHHLPTRYWCSLHLHTRFLRIFEKVTNIVHLIVPFIFNLFSPIIMLIILIQHKRILKPNARIWSNFKDVLYTYKRNIIVPYILVFLTIPYLVVTFRLNCITQSWQNIVYFVAYLIYLLPMMISLFIFVLPSLTFREEFRKMCQNFISYICMRQY